MAPNPAWAASAAAIPSPSRKAIGAPNRPILRITPAHWRVVEELQALVDPAVAEACRGVRLGRFSERRADTLSACQPLLGERSVGTAANMAEACSGALTIPGGRALICPG